MYEADGIRLFEKLYPVGQEQVSADVIENMSIIFPLIINKYLIIEVLAGLLHPFCFFLCPSSPLEVKFGNFLFRIQNYWVILIGKVPQILLLSHNRIFVLQTQLICSLDLIHSV